MQNLQFDMFIEKTPLSVEEAHLFRMEMKAILETSIKVRKAMFGRLAEQNKLILKLMQDIDELNGKRKPIILEFLDPEPDLFRKYN